MNRKFKKITILTGQYGAGKTNLAVNLAFEMCRCGKVTVIDLDTVNPYFRTSDFREKFEYKSIQLISPIYANTNLDIPVLDFDMKYAIENTDFLIIDVGGDDAGAYVLGRYNDIFKEYITDTDMFYVFNIYRSPDFHINDITENIRQIETASRLQCTGLVNNSNLGDDTSSDILFKSLAYADKISGKTKIPIVFTCKCNNDIVISENDFLIEIMVLPPWNFTKRSDTK